MEENPNKLCLVKRLEPNDSRSWLVEEMLEKAKSITKEKNIPKCVVVYCDDHGKVNYLNAGATGLEAIGMLEEAKFNIFG